MSNTRKAFVVVLVLIMVFSMTAAAFGDSDLTASEVKSMKPSGVKAATYSYSKIKVSWDKMNGVDGYQVYRSTSKNGTYKRAYSTTDPDKNWYINTNRTTGKTYYYKVRGYKEINGKKVYTKFYAVKSAYARPNKVKNVGIDTCSTDALHIFHDFTIRWDKVYGATGYQVYMREVGTEKYTWMGNFKENNADIEIPDERILYDIKVRSYRTVNGKKVYGYFSEVSNYEIEWTAEMLKKAAEDYLLNSYEGIVFNDEHSDGSKKNPWDGMVSWSAIWPKCYSYYEPWEEVNKDLEESIDLDMEIQDGVNYLHMYLDYENAEPNHIYIYLIM